ncbi:GlxA family transcriptional regulator [Nitratireductor luteus]|uniref:GlxA family transcriptional regulator n=1 Tax=Nitratireductor luteus TaxID=2976980 RepID=UPI00223EACC5|nr:helix-turn-helix domain-containing protein [Nitratireductor luteus]
MHEKKPILSVGLLTLPESYPGALYSLHELLGMAGRGWAHVTGEPEAASCRFSPRLVSRDGLAVASPAGPSIAVEAALEDMAQPDIVIVADLAFRLDGDTRGLWTEEAAWARRAYAAGAVVCSICSGSLFLAEAGLLNGIEATTHWSAAPVFRDHYPQVRLRPERILCPAGPEHRIVSAGGASTWAELGLYLIARFSGSLEARRMSKIFLLGDKSDGQLPFAAMARPRQHEDGAVAAAQLWIADNYSAPNPVGRMAEAAGLPERTFSRRFRKATGYGPVEYVQAMRIEEAKQMLETTAEPTDSIALAIGYADPVFFRRIFKRTVGVTPARYRQRFSAFLRA